MTTAGYVRLQLDDLEVESLTMPWTGAIPVLESLNEHSMTEMGASSAAPCGVFLCSCCCCGSCG
ncbi:hypothetical protein WEH80_10785 [Actinomycetes bacterium KLBMP 9759]